MDDLSIADLAKIISNLPDEHQADIVPLIKNLIYLGDKLIESQTERLKLQDELIMMHHIVQTLQLQVYNLQQPQWSQN